MTDKVDALLRCPRSRTVGPVGGGAGGGGGVTTLAEAAVRDIAITVLEFTETSGTACADSSPARRAGITYGAGVNLNQTPPGDLAGAIDLPGSNQATQRVNLTDRFGIEVLPWSFEMVAKIDGPGTHGDGAHCTLVGANGTNRYLVDTVNGDLFLQNYLQGTSLTANGAFPIGSWFHMIHSMDVDNAGVKNKLYVNGVEKTVTTSFTHSTVLFGYLGSYGDNNYALNGGIAFFALYPWAIRDQALVDEHFALSGL